MDSAILSAAAAAGLVIRLTGAPDVQLSDRSIQVSDVAQVDGLDAAVVGARVIAEVMAEGPVEVSRDDLARLIRRAVPAADVTGQASGSIRIHSPAAPVAGTASPYVDERQVTRGNELTLTTTAGPVTIRRKVVALQDATSRHSKVFVRSADGEVFAAPTGVAK